MNLLPLHFMQPGESALIHDIDGGDNDIHRLAELGIRPGAQVQMVRPGMPCILKVGGQRFTMRLDPNVMVTVTLDMRPALQLSDVAPDVSALGEAS